MHVEWKIVTDNRRWREN